MNTTKAINSLWGQLQDFVNQASNGYGSEATQALADYTSNSSHHDMANLLERETQNERKHRGFAPQGYRAPISPAVAAKLILCGNFAEGSKMDREPSAVGLLVWRHTAVEMNAIGWLCRGVVTEEWRKELAKLDYAEIMRAA